MFPMNIPKSIGKLGDPRGIPLLLDLLASVAPDEPPLQGGSDSDDEIFMSIGKDRLYTEACLALVRFKDHPEVIKALQDGLKNKILMDSCQTALYMIAGENQYLLPIIQKLNQGQDINPYIKRYLLKKDKSGQFSLAVDKFSKAEKERAEKERIADEIGIEYWEPTEEQMAKFRKEKKIDMHGCKTQKLHPKLFTLAEDITQIELGDNRMTSIPVELTKFKNLRKLNLQANRLKGPLDETICLLTSLTNLGFHGNQIESLPDSIGNLTNLKKLMISCNSLKSIPSSIGQLINLESLNLDLNQIISIPSTIGQLTKLTRLDLSSNKLTSLPPEINQLVLVEYFFIQENELTELPDLSNLTKLNLLNVSKNKLKEIPESLKKINNLISKQK